MNFSKRAKLTKNNIKHTSMNKSTTETLNRLIAAAKKEKEMTPDEAARNEEILAGMLQAFRDHRP